MAFASYKPRAVVLGMFNSNATGWIGKELTVVSVTETTAQGEVETTLANASLVNGAASQAVVSLSHGTYVR